MEMWRRRMEVKAEVWRVSRKEEIKGGRVRVVRVERMEDMGVGFPVRWKERRVEVLL